MRNLIRSILSLGLVMGAAGCGPSPADKSVEGLALAGVPGLTGARLLEDTTVVVRRVWAGSAGGPGTPSPDGRYVTVHQQAGSFGRLDLLTGEVLPIKEKGTWSEAQEWAEGPVFSPDGTQVAYVYFFEGYEIRVSGADGTGERTLVPPEAMGYASLHAWKGNEIIAEMSLGDERVYGLVGISAVDGSIRVIRQFDESWVDQNYLEAPLALSPDGRFLTQGRQSPGGDADVAILRAEDGAEVGQIEGPGNDVAVAWTPDGSGLLIHSDREMTEGLWRAPVEDGMVAGEFELIRGDLWQFSPMGSSRDAYFFSVNTEISRVRLAAFDLASGALTSDPTAVEHVAAGPTRSPIWSPDGTAMAYLKPASGGDQINPSILVVRSLSGPDAREILLPFRGFGLGAWTPDGRIVTIGKRPESDDRDVWSVDLESGQAEALFGEPGSELGRRWVRSIAPDGRTLYHTRNSRVEGELEWDVVARDLATGEERTIAGPFQEDSEGYPLRAYLSPDGETLAFILQDDSDDATVLSVLPTSGGSLRELFRRRAPDGISQSMGVSLVPGRDQLLFSTHGVPATGEPERIWKADHSGPEPVVVELQGAEGLKGASEMAIHPDGSRIAFVVGPWRSEVWMMTNLSGGGR